jgi:DNA-binding protein Fis
VEAAAVQEPPPPLGRWLAEDLLLAAHATAGGVQARAAARLGVPKSTYQRRLRQAQAEGPRAARPPGWAAVREHLAGLVAAVHPPGTEVLREARMRLLARVRERLPGDDAQAAALMGVTVKTWRRWLTTGARGGS